MCSFTNKQLLVRFSLARHVTEVRVQRLLMYQSRASHPEDLLQPIASIFGQWNNNNFHEFSLDGRPVHAYEQAKTWSQQVVEDFKALCDIEGGRICSSGWISGLQFCSRLFTSADIITRLTEEFLSIHVRQLRHAYYMQEVHPYLLFSLIAAHGFIGRRHCFVLP